MDIMKQKIVGVFIFAVAMAALEAAVVVYLRELYYPDEFTVAFKLVDEHIIVTELARELATLVMLLSIGYLMSKLWSVRFAYFLTSFAIWDIFYYVWLKVFIDWPATFFDWDILFLIPFTWIGPVAAPIICSFTMLVMAFIILYFKIEKINSKRMWLFLVSGSLLILFTFTRDYALFIFTNGFISDYTNLLHNTIFLEKAAQFTPKPYAWNLFWAGEFLIVLAIADLFLHRNAIKVSRVAKISLDKI